MPELTNEDRAANVADALRRFSLRTRFTLDLPCRSAGTPVDGGERATELTPLKQAYRTWLRERRAVSEAEDRGDACAQDWEDSDDTGIRLLQDLGAFLGLEEEGKNELTPRQQADQARTHELLAENVAELVGDFLCDLRHFCDRHGVDFNAANDHGQHHYDAEVDEEGADHG